MTQTVAECVYQEIRRRILDGRITPGTRVSIRSLAQSIGVSTMPTREALKRLHYEGLVEFDRRAVTVTSLNAQDIRQLFAIRLTLELLATEWALSRLDHQSTVTMRKILDQMAEPDIAAVEWRELNREFHQTFYDCAGSRHLSELIQNTWDRVQPYMAIYANVAHALEDARRQHEHMFGLMREGRLEELLEATRHHLAHTADAIVDALDVAFASGKEQDMNYAEVTIDDFHRMIKGRETTSAKLTGWYLSRIDDIDAMDNPSGLQINSVVTVNPEAMQDAARIDEIHARTGGLVGPLHGVPVLIKDQAETRGIPTAFGSGLFADYIPDTDAVVVQRLRDAGAIILGKTSMCDFAAGWFSFSSRSDHTKNPYDVDRDTGGSSAGTAAAVTANLCLVGIGEDTGGSIRLPSSFTNLFGLRVTTGLIPRTGFSPLLHFQDTPGPMARTVADLAHVLDTIVGYDASDAYTGVATANPDVGKYYASLDDVTSTSLATYRVGVLADAFGEGCDQEQTNSVIHSAIEDLSRFGTGVIEDLHLGDLEGWVRETSLYTLRSKQDIDAFLRERPAAPATSVKDIVARNAFHHLTDLLKDIGDGPDNVDDNPEYLRGRIRQEEWRRTLVSMMAKADIDFLVYPTVQVPAPTRADLAAKRWTALDFPTNTVIASQTSLPAISIPVGFTDTGLPVGMEVLGRQFSERALLRFARAWELASNPRKSAASTLRAES